jgi:shikimate dehydrogenase
MNRLFGLVGHPLSHSFSKSYFTRKFSTENIRNCRYENFSIKDIAHLPGLIETQPDLAGFNVTIPHKETILPYLDRLSAAASKIGAVNTVKIIRNGNKIETCGFNTDVNGFEETLKINGLTKPFKTLILGTGGASKAVEWVLDKQGCELIFATRTPSRQNHMSYNEITDSLIHSFQLVVNTTPLGMYPHVDDYPPLPYHSVRKDCSFIDLIYNPKETAFMRKAKEMNCMAINGLYMLEQQAEKAWKIWNSADF